MDTMEHNYPRVAARATLFTILLALGALVWWLFFQPTTEAPGTATSTQGQQAANQMQGPFEPLQLMTATGAHDLKIERAVTPEAQALGLMYRTELAADSGMLFVHDKPRDVAMWMKNTYIPLDMVFLKADGTVHRIEHKTEPHSEAMISSNGPVAAVLEIAGGAAERYGLKPGDKVRHPFFTSQGR